MTTIQWFVLIGSVTYIVLGYSILWFLEEDKTIKNPLIFLFYILTIQIVFFYKWIEYGILLLRGKRNNSKIIKREIIKVL